MTKPFHLLTSAVAIALSGAAAHAETLTILMTDGLDKTAMQAVADGYEASHPDVDIKIQSLPFSQFFSVTDMRLRAGGNGIDLVYTDAPLVASYAANGYIQPFSGDVAARAKDNLVGTAVTAGTFEDQLYALSMNSSAQVMFYNKDLLKAAGVTPPAGIDPESVMSADDIKTLATQDRWTWEQVARAARATTKSENGRTSTWGFAWEQYAELYQLQPLGASLGGKMISDDTTSAEGQLDGKAWTEAARWYAKLYNVDKTSPRAINFGDAPALFKQGKLAMFIGGTWNVGAMADSGINFGIAPHPYFKDGKVATPTGSWLLSVTENSAHPDVAADFAQYAALDPEGTQIWYKSLNQLPTTLALLNRIGTDPAYDTYPGNVMRLSAWESVHTAVTRPVTVAYNQLSDAFHTAFSDIANGVDVDEALSEAVDSYDDAARRLNH